MTIAEARASDRRSRSIAEASRDHLPQEPDNLDQLRRRVNELGDRHTGEDTERE